MLAVHPLRVALPGAYPEVDPHQPFADDGRFPREGVSKGPGSHDGSGERN